MMNAGYSSKSVQFSEYNWQMKEDNEIYLGKRILGI
jgi:hypothetical protein